MGCIHVHIFLCIESEGFMYLCVGVYTVPCKE